MLNKIVVALFALLFCCSVSPAQSNENRGLAQWEFLEVSEPNQYSNIAVLTQNYDYRTSEILVIGESSLKWMNTSGWELVSVVPIPENPIRLFFKRPFNKIRTDNEIKQLKQNLEKLNQTPSKSSTDLVDLDEREFRQKLADYNKGNAANLRAAIEQIKNLPLKIISVQSKSLEIGKELSSAEVVLDGTSMLLKDGGNYRSSETEKVYQDAVKQIIEILRLDSRFDRINGNAQGISKGYFKPRPIGKSSDLYGEVTITISVIINAGNQQNIVAQNTFSGYRIKEKSAN